MHVWFRLRSVCQCFFLLSLCKVYIYTWSDIIKSASILSSQGKGPVESSTPPSEGSAAQGIWVHGIIYMQIILLHSTADCNQMKYLLSKSKAQNDNNYPLSGQCKGKKQIKNSPHKGKVIQHTVPSKSITIMLYAPSKCHQLTNTQSFRGAYLA